MTTKFAHHDLPEEGDSSGGAFAADDLLWGQYECGSATGTSYAWVGGGLAPSFPSDAFPESSIAIRHDLIEVECALSYPPPTFDDIFGLQSWESIGVLGSPPITYSIPALNDNCQLVSPVSLSKPVLSTLQYDSLPSEHDILQPPIAPTKPRRTRINKKPIEVGTNPYGRMGTKRCLLCRKRRQKASVLP
jgi:hypothetical protein